MPECTDRVKVSYTITFDSAFHCGSGLPRHLLDRSIRRDHGGNLIVPGSTVKGALRDRCEQLARLFGLTARSPHDDGEAVYEYESPDLVSRLFGSRVRPGSLFFDDLKLPAGDPMCQERFRPLQKTERTQVSISRRTGTARPKFLFSSEYGVADLSFTGEIDGHVPRLLLDDDETLPSYPLLLLWAGLLSLDRIGGNKSAGAGSCRVEVSGFTVNGSAMNAENWFEWLGFLSDFGRGVPA